MPDEKDPALDGEEDGYRTDTFSRGDGEGLPGPEVDKADVSRSLEAGEEGEFETDTFSRGDSEGLPGVGESKD
jgi:hypothetical protein